MQVGIGYDLHRLVPDRKLFLGGVVVEYELGLYGHSDADVVLHAVIDSLLGACSLGDIGDLFPDTDPAYKDIDSTKLLAKVLTLMAEHGFSIVHVDVIIHAEKPKLKNHKPIIRARLAELMDLSLDQVNVKAKTNEKLDAVGRGEAIAAWSAATVSKK
jgi:2-C-methyl-D-erythritol 2,4-cyclodiphosphate synthase